MTKNSTIGAALVGGYLLGRTKKAKTAIGLGMFLAGKKLSLDPRQLSKLVAGSPALGSLNDQIRRELVDATKSAATSALTRRATGLADSLHKRTQEIGNPNGHEDRNGEAEDGGRPGSGADRRDRDRGDEERPRRRTSSMSGGGSKTAGAEKASSGGRRAASGKKNSTERGTRDD